MNHVSLQSINENTRADCLALRVANSQLDLVAPHSESLDDAVTNLKFVPLGIYAADEKFQSIMVGFTMYEVSAGLGFIRRLMIDQRFQGKGYGRSAMVEVIRRLRLLPDVETIATRHRRENVAAGSLYRSLGFVDWKTELALEHPSEVYLWYPGP